MKRDKTMKTKPMSAEECRKRELSRIACERRQEMLRARSPRLNAGGLWFVEQYLPDDLKEEWRALNAIRT